MFELKTLHKDAIPAAIAKAERYRFINDPNAAESICRDILHVDPTNQAVLVTLILCITDQFATMGQTLVNSARELIPKLSSEYQRAYYSGIICERSGKAHFHRGTYGAGSVTYEWLREAMSWYEVAEKVHPTGVDDPILRWNSCARMIMSNKLTPHKDDHGAPGFSEG